MIQQVGQEQFRVPKFCITVICHTTHEILQGDIFLDVVETSRSLLQRVLDFFNASNPFFPIRISGTERPILLRKDALIQVDILQAMDPLETEMFGDPLENPTAVVTRKIERERVRNALLQLTPEQRQVIVLRFFEDWPHEEIASLIGKTAAATRALQHRALIGLQKMLIEPEV